MFQKVEPLILPGAPSKAHIKANINSVDESMITLSDDWDTLGLKFDEALALHAWLTAALGIGDGYRIFKDGNAWCATGPGFIDLQASEAGFGDSPSAALAELLAAAPASPEETK